MQPGTGLLPLLALILVFAAGVALIAALMLRFASSLTTYLVTEPFTSVEYIVEHHRPPPEWIRSRTPLERLLNHKAEGEAEYLVPMNDRQRQRLKARLLGRLAKLIRYFETSAFFDSEDTRTQLLAELAQIRASWEQQELDDILLLRRE